MLVPIVAYVFWMAYRIWGPKKPKEDEDRMIENVIFDVGNVLMGYDWEEYLKSYNFPEEKYQKSQMQHFEIQSGRSRTEHSMRNPGMWINL